MLDYLQHIYNIKPDFNIFQSHNVCRANSLFFGARNRGSATIKNSSWGTERARKWGKNRADVLQKKKENSPPFQARHWDSHPSTHRRTAHAHSSSAPCSEQKRQMYTSIPPYILRALTAFQQLPVPMQMSRLSPTPNWGEVIWAAEYKWLGMIDGPSHSPPSSNR